MIRQLAVPPFDRLEPFLPKRWVTDVATRDQVAEILADVAARGDQAVRHWAREFDGVDIPPEEWELPRAEWEAALDRIDLELRDALEVAVERVRAYHARQRDNGFRVLEEDGTILGMRVLPLDRVGLYVPGGKAAYPSSVIMNTVPATVAGVEEIIAVTPPAGITDAVLAACLLSGVSRLFRIGGAQAIGALAYGTTTIGRVDKIVGPGSRWVAEAKRQVAGPVGIDLFAGPTELVIIADSTAPVEHVAADLIAQAEHDEDATAWCVTTDSDLADRLPMALDHLLASNPRVDVARASLERNGLLVWVPTLRDAATVANLRAPEHLEVICQSPEAIADLVRHAGAIFLGDVTPEPVGDYIAGPSHVLPTSGTARYASPLGVYDFVRRTSIISYGRDRLYGDAARIIALANAEGLVGHAEAVRRRLAE